jgi:small subunit ribosomal protein S6e
MIEIEDEHKLLAYYEKRMGSEVKGDNLGDEYKGYIFRITGGNDRQGFPMMQGVLKNQRVRLLFKKGMPCYRERRKGIRKRKSVRGCIVGHDLAILNLVLVKEGKKPVEGLTDGTAVRRLGPKRASKIRKLYDLTKSDDIKKFVIRREIKSGEGDDEKVKNTKAPKIQRLVTPITLQRKRSIKNTMLKKVRANREEIINYKKVMHDYKIAQKEKRQSEIARKKAGKKKKTTKSE